MATLPNEQHELFCQLVAKGSTGADAARAAGYVRSKPANTASELNRRPVIKARIEELRAEYLSAANRAATKAGAKAGAAEKLAELDERAGDSRSAEAVLRHLWDQVERAYAAGNIPAGTKALELLAKHHGLLIERTMQVRSPLDDLTAEQLTGLLRLAERLAAPRPETIPVPLRLPPVIEGEASRGE